MAEREWCCSEYIVRGARVDMTERPSGHFELDLCPSERRILARVGPES